MQTLPPGSASPTKRAKLRDALRVYGEKRILAIFFMGFSSGLPLGLTGATLTYWLSEASVSRTSIGLFALVGLSYSYKFLWAPVIDRIPIPLLTRRLGRRRSWGLLIQALLMAAIFLLGHSDPQGDLATLALLAVIVAFLSASQDIVIDAYRIELLKPEEQGAGAAATQWGYRLGMLASGAGAFYLAAFGDWRLAYTVMALLMAVGMATILLTPEPAVILPRVRPGETWLATLLVRPFSDFIERCGGRLDRRRSFVGRAAAFLWSGRAAFLILGFIVLYKLGEAMAGFMASPLYQQLGFTKIEVANIAKIFGVIATLAGVACGGVIVARFGIMTGLLVGGLLQMLSNLMYVAQVLAGHDTTMLAISIFTENFTNGMGSAAFVAYLSSLCSPAFTATQYALFSSLTALPRSFLSAPSGWLVDRLDWIPFFLLTTAAAVPGLLVLLWLMRHPSPSPLREPAARPARVG
ncbi:MAG TPA: AmpG family muropeptide MFS transporter [Stellaceae bacterium]|nr:AmpG family muropeptide MFS transporter [Stellaceae bacterium]